MRAFALALTLITVALAGAVGGTASAPAAASLGQAAPDDGSAGDDSGWENGSTVAKGHIVAGSPTIYTCSLTVCAGIEGIESFRMDEVPPPGWTIATNTTDNGGLGYTMNLYFHDENGSFLGGCEQPIAVGQARERTCTVPDDAASGTVDASYGLDLDVVVRVVATP